MSRARQFLRNAVRRSLVRRGWEIRHANSIHMQHADLDGRFAEIFERVGTETMTPIERLSALYEAVRYVVRDEIPGDVVECGVWAGGSCMLAAHTLLDARDDDRRIWLYDTFSGMTEPSERDRSLRGQQATRTWDALQARDDARWCYAPLEQVRENMLATGFPEDRLRFVEGPVEDTIPASIPERISVLRLDTDWYESTRHELLHLYPRLSPGGVLILDDYGHWMGSKQAVDEYFEETGQPILLNRVDYAARVGVKLPG